MKQEPLTYQDLARKLLAGRLLRRDERLVAEEVLALEDPAEIAFRLGDLLEGIADRGGLTRLPPRAGDRPSLRRYRDPGTEDRLTMELPSGRERPGAPGAPPAARPAPPVEDVHLVPAVPARFQRNGGGPFDALFSSFSPSRTPEEIGHALAPIRAQLVERTSATDVRFHFLLDPEGQLVAVPIRDRPAHAFEPLGGRVETDVLRARRTLHVPRLAAAGTGARPGASGALVSLPLAAGERSIGLMEVLRDTDGAFDPEELQFFAMAALAAAGLVERAEVLEKLIFLDKLTGLYNRAYFDSQIEREIERANRGGTSVALLMADLDEFKKVNDTRGHLAGDLALAHAGSIIRGHVRAIDVAARYGGEEFAVLMPSNVRSRPDLATEAAERLRRVVAEADAGSSAAALAGMRITVSIGVALYPEDASTAKQLIDRADVALYTAKRWGRNRVVSWAEAREANEQSTSGR
jgi:diguanylate cyclase (GGDEF)-like protein